MMLNAATVRKMANPGKTASHHAYSMFCSAEKRMFPHDGVGRGTPKPRKESADSMRTAEATPKLADTRTGANAFGSRCRKMIRE